MKIALDKRAINYVNFKRIIDRKQMRKFERRRTESTINRKTLQFLNEMVHV